MKKSHPFASFIYISSSDLAACSDQRPTFVISCPTYARLAVLSQIYQLLSQSKRHAPNRCRPRKCWNNGGRRGRARRRLPRNMRLALNGPWDANSFVPLALRSGEELFTQRHMARARSRRIMRCDTYICTSLVPQWLFRSKINLIMIYNTNRAYGKQRLITKSGKNFVRW